MLPVTVGVYAPPTCSNASGLVLPMPTLPANVLVSFPKVLAAFRRGMLPDSRASASVPLPRFVAFR